MGNAEAGRRIRPEFLGFLAGALGVAVADLAADREEFRLTGWHQRRIERVLTTMEAFAVESDLMEYKRLVSPDALIEVPGPEAIPMSGEFRGIDGMRRLSEIWEETIVFERVHEISELHSVGNCVEIVGRNGLRSVATDKSVVTWFRHRFVFDDDRVVRIQTVFDVPLVAETFKLD